MTSPLRVAWAGFAVALAGVACGGTTSHTDLDAQGGVDAGTDAPTLEASAAADAGVDSGSDTGSKSGVDGSAESSGSSDGPPTYTSTCTPLSAERGTAIDTMHGRLDGYLSFIVPIGGSGACNGDESHVHLQVRVLGSIYDVAVDTGEFTGDVSLYEADMPLPDGAWSEGWHGSDDLTYTTLGVHSTQFAPQDPAALGTKLASELTGVNHVSVFGTGYSQGNGCHDIHYESGDGHDGALVIEPLSATPHILFFRFSTDTF